MNSPNPQSNPLLINGGGRLTPEGECFTPATGQMFLVPAPVCPQEEYKPAMTIPDMIRALVEVKRYCHHRSQTMVYQCDGCEFCGRYCLIDNCPEFWGTNELERKLKDGSAGQTD